MGSCGAPLSRLLLSGLLLLAGCGAEDDPWTALREGDYSTARLLLEPLADAGDIPAQNMLGTLYYLGLGTARDFQQSLAWYGKAALAGEPHAQRNLGSMFRHGHGTPRDDFRAFGWYAESLRSGNPGAQEYLRLTALSVGWNQQAVALRIVEEDLKKQQVSHRGRPALPASVRNSGLP